MNGFVTEEGSGAFLVCASDVSRRAFKTISSGLGPSKAKPPDPYKSGILGGFLRLERCLGSSGCFPFSLFCLASRVASLSGTSSTSKEAKAEGAARVRVGLGKNIGGIEGGGASGATGAG